MTIFLEWMTKDYPKSSCRFRLREDTKMLIDYSYRYKDKRKTNISENSLQDLWTSSLGTKKDRDRSDKMVLKTLLQPAITSFGVQGKGENASTNIPLTLTCNPQTCNTCCLLCKLLAGFECDMRHRRYDWQRKYRLSEPHSPKPMAESMIYTYISNKHGENQQSRM